MSGMMKRGTMLPPERGHREDDERAEGGCLLVGAGEAGDENAEAR